MMIPGSDFVLKAVSAAFPDEGKKVNLAALLKVLYFFPLFFLILQLIHILSILFNFLI